MIVRSLDKAKGACQSQHPVIFAEDHRFETRDTSYRRCRDKSMQ
jgi:hypothetical protein